MQTTEVTELTRPRVIQLSEKTPVVVDDLWTIVRDEADARQRIQTRGEALKHVVLPVNVYLEAQRFDASTLAATGAWIPPQADFELWAPSLQGAHMIAVDFPSFRDGRGFSIAVMLRTRYGYRGELRAIGDVLRDQLEYMRRCGFNSFAVRPDKSITDALKGFSEITVRYQGDANDPTPLFRRR
ncbi:uncharacterized protein (DUF934 family) [Paraburkholderia sp. BL23I1N1]|uniref:DUF934 domain-containing protein n=1 Tax=Paraburkholderia sp. BL23I1N1 TaxID=1938802 RepID=UPI000FF752FD|nr:DUF934 domain-containing protein [Paraburkholderia sp. BL23I1N1]RKE35087.1 uncharacterized protein (DUF934 family) [Paraburkholderia sp. BL23I1N1]